MRGVSQGCPSTDSPTDPASCPSHPNCPIARTAPASSGCSTQSRGQTRPLLASSACPHRHQTGVPAGKEPAGREPAGREPAGREPSRIGPRGPMAKRPAVLAPQPCWQHSSIGRRCGSPEGAPQHGPLSTARDAGWCWCMRPSVHPDAGACGSPSPAPRMHQPTVLLARPSYVATQLARPSYPAIQLARQPDRSQCLNSRSNQTGLV
jgi:hypothetical protein